MSDTGSSGSVLLLAEGNGGNSGALDLPRDSSFNDHDNYVRAAI